MINKKLLIFSFENEEANIITASLKKNGEYSPDSFVHSTAQGFENGIVTDLSLASDSIQKICNKINAEEKQKTHKIVLAVSTSSVSIVDSTATVLISKYAREITRHDIDLCLKLGGTIKLPDNKDIFHKMIVDFNVDNDRGISNPLGLEAVKLGVRMKLILVDSTLTKNLEKAVSLGGYDLKKIILNPLATYLRVFEKGKKTADILVNMNKCSLEISIFDANVLVEYKYIEKVASGISGKFSLIHPQALAEEIMAMKNFKKATSIHIVGDIFDNDMVATQVEEITGIYTVYGRCFEREQEGLPEDRLRYISALGAIDFINKEIKVSKPSSIISAMKMKILAFCDEYF
ncbi:MAG: hypothetical protein HQL29_00390 [Candidatus Omnitrophica bacterium]|nr:hypothetical protein [Candidatus Omnitrophota bacterium]